MDNQFKSSVALRYLNGDYIVIPITLKSRNYPRFLEYCGRRFSVSKITSNNKVIYREIPEPLTRNKDEVNEFDPFVEIERLSETIELQQVSIHKLNKNLDEKNKILESYRQYVKKLENKNK